MARSSFYAMIRPARRAAAGKASGTEARDLGPGAAGGDRNLGIALGGRGLPQALMPRTSCGAPMAFGCSRWTTAGAGSSPPSSIGTPSVSAGMSASAATASPPCSRSPWGLPGCMAMDHGSQYLSDHFTNQIKSHLPQHRGAAGRRPRLRRTLQCPVDRRKERLPEPRSSSSGVARRDLNQARRVRQTCVQGTGCATTATQFSSESSGRPINGAANIKNGADPDN